MFSSLGDEVKGKTIALGGDGRYFNKDAAQVAALTAWHHSDSKADSNITAHRSSTKREFDCDIGAAMC